jgi:hypothetical protein
LTLTAGAQPAHANHLLEGGLFFPVGYIVAALPGAGDAVRARDTFLAAGYTPNECLVVTPQCMADAAAEDLDAHWFIAALGSSAQVREQQLRLARQEHCEFLIVRAPSEAERARVLRVLSGMPVSYAVQYHRFVIEDLIDRIPSSTADHHCARVS